ncbi:MAG TPA: hypothetical protein EYP98_07220, partial [Planctomycetes bacterium]|nr:hypothetical protein [Planctomycetota bacterium]
LGADQVRNAGTIGGNIANGSPIGDMPPALIALDAKLVLESSAGERILNLEVSDEELEKRRAAWTPPEFNFDRGYTRLYLDHVTQADVGVAMNSGTPAAKEAANLIDLDSDARSPEQICWVMSCDLGPWIAIMPSD